jgi:hypothetical protein
MNLNLILRCSLSHSHNSNMYQLSCVETNRRAIQAAAAKAVDNFALPREYLRCYDASIMLSSGPVLPPFPYSIASQLIEKRMRSEYWANACGDHNMM